MINQRQTLALIAGVFLVVGIGSLLMRESREEQQRQVQREAAALVEITPIDEGEGIFYFPVTGESYRRSLAAFYKTGKARHCDLQGFTEEKEIRYQTSRTITTGFILHCHGLAVEAQSITVP